LQSRSVTYHLSLILKNPFKASIIIFALAFVFRLIVMMALSETPYWSHNLVDAKLYHDWAAGLAEGANPHPAPYFYSPVYPFLLSLVYRIFGVSLTAARMLQCISGSFLCVLVYLLARKMLSWQTAFVAGIVCASSGILAFYDNLLLKTSMVTLVLFAAIYLIFLDIEKRNLSYLRYAGAGLLLGLASTLRGNALAVAFVVFIFILLSSVKKKNPFPALALAGGLIIAVLPLTIANYAASGEFILTTYSGGFNFYEGNSAEANGYHPALASVRQTASHEQDDAVAAAREALAREPSPRDVSAYWSGRAWEDISARPSRWFGLLVFKSTLFVNAAEIPDNYNYSFVSRQMAPLIASPFGFYLIAPLALAGLGVALARGGRLRMLAILTMAYCASVVIFYVTSRYRAPVYPFFAVFAALAVEDFAARIARQDFQRALILLVAVFGLFVAVNRELVPAELGYDREYYVLGTVKLENGDWAGAADSLMEALELHPYSAQVENNLGASYLRAARDKDANKATFLEISASHLRRATELEPDYFAAWKNLGLAMAMSGRTGEAREAFETACRLAPTPEQRKKTCSILEQLGR